MYYPSKKEFKGLATEYNLIPVYRDIIADLDTPVSAFQKIQGAENAFLLESAEQGDKLGRYSFLGANPYLVIACSNGVATIRNGTSVRKRKTTDPLAVIEELMSEYRPAKYPDFPPFSGGAVGFLGYDAIKYFEDIPRTGEDDLKLPEMVFVITDTILIFDHLKHKIKVVANAHVNGDADTVYDQALEKIDRLIDQLRSAPPQDPANRDVGDRGKRPKRPAEVRSNMSKEQFLTAVEKAKEYIAAGDILQTVLSQRFCAEVDVSPFEMYRALRTINPSPYMYYLKLGDFALVGSSPEPLVKVHDGTVETRPIAGTRPRGKDRDEDMELEGELLADEKERAEHIMLVDLGRNDIGRVCGTGSVEVEDLMFIERYSHVMHIVSSVCGRLAPGKNAFDVLRAAFPAGTVSGAPKIRAMEIIDELEPTHRGPYAGIVGYFDYSGNLDCCITIRTIIVTGGCAYVQAGAGIVYDSIPEKEFEETENKAGALLGAVRLGEEGLR
jgi:anthranilate synthase component 1